jgi:hypothetical protein
MERLVGRAVAAASAFGDWFPRRQLAWDDHRRPLVAIAHALPEERGSGMRHCRYVARGGRRQRAARDR